MYKEKIVFLSKFLQNFLNFNNRISTDGLKHIIFLFVDHYELAGKAPRLEKWLEIYPTIAKKHKDADGCKPKHTWFYAMDLIIEKELELLQCFVEEMIGEIELHWHHSHDTPSSFEKKITTGLKIFQKYGYMKPVEDGKPGCFGFIHGNWSLDNSRGDQYCGVNNEIEMLIKAGCYGDFTFPALFSISQPKIINRLYYAVDNEKPKSYNTGRIAQKNKKSNNNEFLIFQGPLAINWTDWRFGWHPTIEDGEINRQCTHDDPKRITSWIKQNIHVKGRPDWIFVKTFCHGGQDYASVLSEATDRMFEFLERNYNDGEKYCLHYVSAREAYNIVKAAEDGKEGNPNKYRDYIIPHPLNR